MNHSQQLESFLEKWTELICIPNIMDNPIVSESIEEFPTPRHIFEAENLCF